MPRSIAGTAPARIHGTITERGTERALAARIILTDLTTNKVLDTQYSWHPGFWAQGEFSIDVAPGAYKILVARGHFYQPHEQEIYVGSGQDIRVDALLIHDLPDHFRDWISGDSHGHHVHGEREFETTVERDALITNGEGLGYLNISDDRQYFTIDEKREHIKTFSDVDFLFGWNKEYPKEWYGHNWSVGEVSFPYNEQLWSSSIRENFRYYNLMDAAGAVVVNAHPNNGWFEGKTYVSNLSAGLPVDLAIGAKTHAIDCFIEDEDQRLYFQLLNAGYRLIGVCASDFCLDRDSQNAIPGGYRLYTRHTGPFEVKAIAASIKTGANFCSSGPLIDLQIGDHGIGDVATTPDQPVTAVITVAASRLPGEFIDQIELIENGSVIGTWPIESNLKNAEITVQLTVNRGSWFVARCTGRSLGDHNWGNLPHHALTNPIWFDPKPAPDPVTSEVRIRIKDRGTQLPLPATITVFDLAGNEIQTAAIDGVTAITCPAGSVVRASAPGHETVERSVFLASKATQIVRDWVTGKGRPLPPEGQSALSSSPLLDPHSFEIVRDALASVDMEIALPPLNEGNRPSLVSLHNHTTLSRCAREEMTFEAVVEHATRLGYSHIALTDHVHTPELDNIPDQVARLTEYKRLRDNLDGQLQIAIGVEFEVWAPGRIRAPEDILELCEIVAVAPNHFHLPWVDAPTGSVHDISKVELDFLETAVNWEPTNIIVHPFSGHQPTGREWWPEFRYIACDKIRLRDILEQAHERDIAMEIQPKFWKGGHARELSEFFETWLDMGGKVSLGSDAHSLDSFDEWKTLLDAIIDHFTLTTSDIWLPTLQPALV